MIRLVIILLFLSTAANSASSASDELVCQKIVKRFLEWEAREQPNGVYHGIRSQTLNTLLSSELQCLLDAAVTANEVSKRLEPGDKPPFIEGNVFLPVAWERPLKSEITASHAKGNHASVAVTFHYEPDGLKYTSRFWLSRHAGGWKIIDISLGGKCDFCQKGRLRDSLYHTVAGYPETNWKKCKNK